MDRGDDPSPPIVSDGIVPCAYCGKREGQMKRCSRCLSVVYCGHKCQLADWKAHKKACKKAAREQEHLGWRRRQWWLESGSGSPCHR